VVAAASMPHDRAWRATISLFVTLSSTTSRRLPASCVGAPRVALGVGGSVASTGRSTWKVDPEPSSLSAHIVPPINSTRRLEIASPSPVPP
jgi:hypothetical protein